jgi:hypothetical protein
MLSRFSERELEGIAAGCIQGLEQMELHSLAHGHLSTDHIRFIKSTVYLLCPALSTRPSNVELVKSQHHLRDMLKGIYLPPERLVPFRVPSSEKEDPREVKEIKADVFTLGVCLIEACLLETQHRLYIDH